MTAVLEKIGLTRPQVAWRIAQEIDEGSYVNLGIGSPEMVANYVFTNREIVFHSENGILGMGDVLSLVEKAEQTFEQDEQEKLQKKIKTNAFTLEDFRDQLKQVQKMGSMEQLLGMVPGAGKLKGLKIDNGAFVQVEAIINSMTAAERARHNIINASRKRRIAQGSGTRVNDVNKLLKQFSQMQKMMKKISRGGGLNFGSLMGGRGMLGGRFF